MSPVNDERKPNPNQVLIIVNLIRTSGKCTLGFIAFYSVGSGKEQVGGGSSGKG